MRSLPPAERKLSSHPFVYFNRAPISEISSYMWTKAHDRLLSQSPSGHELLITDPVSGKTHSPAPGEVIKNPTLAETFRTLAKEGKKGFYEGRVAEAIVEREPFATPRRRALADLSNLTVVQSQNGVMTLEDLASHTSTPVTPVSIAYGPFRLHECPPNGSGLVALVAVGLLDALEESGAVDMSQLAHNEGAWLHVLM